MLSSAFEILKQSIRQFKYKSEYYKFKKPDFFNDHLFPVVVDLRKQGISVVKNFKDQSENAKKLIDHYEKIGEQKILDEIEKKHQSTLKSSYKIRVTSLFNDDDLVNFANDEFIIANINQYFGFKPYLREVSVVVDYKNELSDIPIHTQNFHRDPDDVKLTKIFFYLNDVSINNGPFQFIKTSHLKPWVLEKFLTSNVFKYYSKDQIFSATGKSGTIIFADTNGYHRGLILNEKFRVMVTAMYTSQNPKFGQLGNIVFK